MGKPSSKSDISQQGSMLLGRNPRALQQPMPVPSKEIQHVRPHDLVISWTSSNYSELSKRRVGLFSLLVL